MRGREDTRALALLFGVLYAVQGIGEPSEGLVAQPVRAMLRDGGHDAASIGLFMATVSLPWSFKPLYGLVCDFVPLFGQHRRSWLLVCTAATALGLFAAWALDLHTARALLPALVVPTLGIAFGDVVVDGLMVDVGQRTGLTGRLQAVQWAALYGASIGNGALGGWLTSTGRPELGFVICAAAALCSFALAWVTVKEPPRTERRSPGEALLALWTAVRHPGLLASGVFLVLWAFNPFTTTVQYLHMTGGLGLSEELYGRSLSVQYTAALLAAVAYGAVASRLSTRVVLHGGVMFGVLSTVAWWGVSDATSAMGASAAFGAAYLVGSLMTMDIAARTCPPGLAATSFAVLMAASNLGASAAEAAGGALYADFGARWGEAAAYDALVGVGAASTAACWLVLPWLARRLE